MKYFFANWKMYLNVAESLALAEDISKLPLPSSVQGVIFPTSLAFTGVQKKLENTTWTVGSQDTAFTSRGAYTGAVSAQMFKEAGARYALVGHSERRHIFGDSDNDVRKKIESCLEIGLTPVLCIGETKEDKANNKRQYRLKKQLFTAFDNLALNGGSIIVAYEPVWAISQAGKGEACAPADAEDIQGWIKLELREYTDQAISVLYGGSVNPENVASYLALNSVDGLLIGSASTTHDSFRSLLEAY